MTTAGFLLALLSAVLFGVYALPRRHSRLGPWPYTLWMALGFTVPALCLAAVLHVGLGEPLPHGAALGRVAEAGTVWAVANIAYVLAIDAAGVARATAVKNLTGLFGTLFGVWLLHEVLAPWAVAIAFLGSAAVAASAVVLGRLTAPDAESAVASESARTADAGRARALGTAMGLVAAVGLGLYLVPGLLAMRAGVSSPMFVATFATAAGLASALAAGFRFALGGRRGAQGPGGSGAGARAPLLAGVLWLGGSLAVTPAAQMAGMAIAWPISQLGFFLILAYAVVRLREVDWATGKRSVYLASALTLAGVVLLGVARSA